MPFDQAQFEGEQRQAAADAVERQAAADLIEAQNLSEELRQRDERIRVTADRLAAEAGENSRAAAQAEDLREAREQVAATK